MNDKNNNVEQWGASSESDRVIYSSQVINSENKAVYLSMVRFLGFTILFCGVAATFLAFFRLHIPQILVMLGSGAIGCMSGTFIKK